MNTMQQLWRLAAAVSLAALSACGPMTPAQQEAAERNRLCSTNPLAHPERCAVFIGGPG
jgi:hypothetical protein